MVNQQIKQAYVNLLKEYYAPQAWPKRIDTRIEIAEKIVKLNNGTLSNKSIIDIGGGIGDFLMLLHGLGGKNLLTINDTPPELKDFKNKEIMDNVFHEYIKKIELDVDCDKLPFSTESVDMIIMLDIIEHLNDPSFCLNEVSRVLKTHGFLVLRTANAVTLMRRMKAFLENHLHPQNLMVGWIKAESQPRVGTANL